jgi:hypothetical protein
MEEFKILLSSLYCGFQDLFMCFGLLSGADLLGILSKILMIWSVHLLSLLVPNLYNFQILLQKKTQKEILFLVFNIGVIAEDSSDAECNMQKTVLNSLGFCEHMFIASPFTFSAGLSPLSGIPYHWYFGGRGHSLHCKESWEIFVCLLFKLLWTQLLKY